MLLEVIAEIKAKKFANILEKKRQYSLNVQYIVRQINAITRKLNQIKKRLTSGSGPSFTQVGAQGRCEGRASEQRPE